ncbi:hypothetical protein HispidOSU_007730, partial [Sigmodon hispidus]
QRGAAAELARLLLDSRIPPGERPRSILQPAAAPRARLAPLLAPGGLPRHRARGAAWARRASSGARLAQKGSLLCITICITFKFTFFYPSRNGPPPPRWNLATPLASSSSPVTLRAGRE